VNVFASPGGSVIGQIAPGATFTVLDATPACYQTGIATNNQTDFRQWNIRSADNVEGWVNEYTRDTLGLTYLIQPAANGGASNCFVSPYPADQGIAVGGHVTVSQSAPANGLPIVQVNSSGAVIESSEYEPLKPGGTLEVIGGPSCRNEGDTTFGPIRQWLVQTSSGLLQGWVPEHTNVPGNTAQYLTPAK
jgi:hypothetical protein